MAGTGSVRTPGSRRVAGGTTAIPPDAAPLIETELARLIILLGLAAAAIGFVFPALLAAAAGSAH
jgi:hypothetical protein